MTVGRTIAVICFLLAVILAFAAILGAPLQQAELLAIAFIAGGLLVQALPIP